MRIAFALPGLHRVRRGAEVAFESLAAELARIPETEVTLFGSGLARPSDPYQFIHISCLPRERFVSFPKLPVLRNEYSWEELSFLPSFLRHYKPSDFDLTIACSYPHLNWALRWRRSFPWNRPRHIFVTQNGDHAPRSRSKEFRWFGCDGLVCTNPDYYRDNSARWNSCLIPNGVDPDLFHPGMPERDRFGLPEGVSVVLMVSALIPSKRVADGIMAVGDLPDVHLVVCGDGPDKSAVRSLGDRVLPGRFHHFSLPRKEMPAMYRTADVFLHMSLDEPSANSYIEALATGLPIVTHDRSVTRWTLEETCILVDATDRTAVSRGLQQSLEPDPAGQISRSLLAKRRFTWRSIAEEYRSFFSRILAG